MIIHRRILYKSTHQHSHIRISHRKFHILFSQLSVHNLKSWILIFLHHESVSPQLNHVKKCLFNLIPPLLHLRHVKLVLKPNLPPSLEQRQKHRWKLLRPQVTMKVQIPILRTNLNQLNCQQYPLRMILGLRIKLVIWSQDLKYQSTCFLALDFCTFYFVWYFHDVHLVELIVFFSSDDVDDFGGWEIVIL